MTPTTPKSVKMRLPRKKHLVLKKGHPLPKPVKMKRFKNATFAETEMPDIFRSSCPKIYERDVDAKYSACHTNHRDIRTLLQHLSRPAHGLLVTERFVSSFDVADPEYPHPRVGLCLTCWASFAHSGRFEKHLSKTCRIKISQQTKLGSWKILRDTFAPMARITKEGSESDTGSTKKGSIEGKKLDIYKSLFIDHLVNDVQKLDVDSESLKRIFNALPLLLRTFALELGRGESTEQRDLMYFFCKYHLEICERFEHAMLQVRNDKGPDPDGGERTSTRVTQWLANLAASTPPRVDKGAAPSAKPAAESLNADSDLLSEKLPDLQAVADSVQYRHLLLRLAREALLTAVADEDAVNTIRRELVGRLRDRRHIQRGTQSDSYSMLFQVQWDPVAFLRQQFPAESLHTLGNVITLTGSMGEAQALPCAQYLRQTWPARGPHVLAAIDHALEVRNLPTDHCLPEGSKIRILDFGFGSARPFRLLATGSADFVTEIGEILSWLAAALQRSPAEEAVAYCVPRVELRFMDPTVPESRNVKITLDTAVESSSSKSAGDCWKGLFLNPVVVGGYPILRRARPNTGLEIQLDMAASLVEAKRLHEFSGQLYLKGFSAMLVPVEKVGNTILWHLYYSKTGERISYCEADTVQPGLGTLDINILRLSRHVVGWCSDAMYMFGDASANYDIRSSNLAIPGKEFTLEKVSFSVGQIVTGGCQFSIGKKDRPVHISKQGYVAKLRWVEQRFVVMWDEEDKRGWLTKGTSALLHLLRASLLHSAKDKFSSEFLFDSKDFHDVVQRFRSDSAIQVLLNPANRKLRLYKLEEETFDNVVEKADGTEEITTTVRRTYVTVEHRITELFETLEKLIDHEAESHTSAKGVNMKPRLRSYLRGWDFRDIVTGRDPLYLRATTPLDSGQTWVGLVDSTRAVTLFGRGFGDLIKPAPLEYAATTMLSEWAAIPTGKGFLGASMADLNDMAEHEGDKGTCPLTLSQGVVWHSPVEHGLFAPIPSEYNAPPAKWNPVQELLSAEPNILKSLLVRKGDSKRIDLDSFLHGAVIFGRHKSSKVTWSRLRGDLLGAGPSDEALGTESGDVEMESMGTQPSGSSSCELGTGIGGSSSLTNADSAISDVQVTTTATGSTGITLPESLSARPSVVSLLQTSMSGSDHGATAAKDGANNQPDFTRVSAATRKRPATAAFIDDDGDDEDEDEQLQRGGITKRLRNVNMSLRESLRKTIGGPSWAKGSEG